METWSKLTNRIRQRRGILGLSLANALLLLVFSFLELRLPHTTDEEFVMLQTTSGIKHVLFRHNRPDPSRFLFVSVSWDKQLIERTDADGVPIGNQDVIDRRKLAQFLHTLNQQPNNHKFLLVDIRFHDPSPDDSLLAAELKNTQRYLVSAHKGEDEKMVQPVVEARTGLSDYETTDEGTVVKYSVIQGDSLRTTPLLMYQQLTGKSYRQGWPVDWMDDKPVLNNFILDYRIILTQDSLNKPNSYYNRIYLGEMLSLPPDFFHELTKDRIVVLGDFEDKDVHDTIYGSMPGPIILLNAFLALENYDNQVSWGFLVFLLVGFTVISHRCFSQRNFFQIRIKTPFRIRPEVSEVVAHFADLLDFTLYLVYFALFSALSYFLFNTHLTILLLAIYMQLLDSLTAYIYKKRAERTETEALLVPTKSP